MMKQKVTKMGKNCKAWQAMVLAVCLTGSLLAGCGATSEASAQTSEAVEAAAEVTEDTITEEVVTEVPEAAAGEDMGTVEAVSAETQAQTGEKTEGQSMALHVEGTKLCNANGEAVQLRGVSTHGLSWYPQYVSRETFTTLRDDWGANTIRLAMYTAEYNGYLTGGDQEALKQLIRDGVAYATELGLYAIVDWHILSDFNPLDHKEEAKAFFAEMSKDLASYDNVIYEICNEPQNSPWESVIKPYAEEVIPVIRENAPNAIILVGTNQWSQKPDEVIGHEIEDPNVMYVLHFYAATHRDDLRKTLKTALDSGLPMFVSECSICEASGNGNIDYDSAQAWLDLMNEYQVSYICWNLANKDEASSVIKADCNKVSGWSAEELNDTGKWFREQMRAAR